MKDHIKYTEMKQQCQAQIAEIKTIMDCAGDSKVLQEITNHLRLKRLHFAAAAEQGIAFQVALSSYSFEYEQEQVNRVQEVKPVPVLDAYLVTTYQIHTTQ